MADRLDILIAEDDPCIAAMLSDILCDLGHRVVAVVDTAEEAIGLAGTKPFDLAVIDVWLAGGSNGLAAVRYLADRCGIPAVVCSGHAAAQDAWAAGAVAFLEKPFRIIDLEQALATVIEAGGPVTAPAGIAAAPAWSPAGYRGRA